MDLGMSVETGIPLPELVEVVKESERLGYKRCWIPDEGIVHRDVFVALGLAAVNTRSILIGTGITNPYIRHPAVTAAAIATVNELSEGRVFFGISAGGSVTLGPLGITPPRPLLAVGEMITLSRALLRGEKVTSSGEFHSLRSARLPYAGGDVEIWLAARGPKMLRLGGQLADGVQIGPVHKDFIEEVVAAVRGGAAQTGNQPKLCYTVSFIQTETALNAIRPHFSFNIVDSPPEIREALGIPPEAVGKIRAALVEGGPKAAGKLLNDEWVLPFVISGTDAECREEIRQLVEKHGFDEIRITLPGIRPDLGELARLSELLLDV